MDTIFNVVDFGARPDSGQNDAAALRLAVRAASACPGGTLIFPPGQYLLSDPEAVRLQEDAMSGRMGPHLERTLFERHYPYVIGLDFGGAQGLTVEAGGAELLCDGWMEPVSLRQCRHVRIKGLTIDYKRRPHSCAAVTAVHADAIDVRFDARYPFGDTCHFGALMIYDPEKRAIITPRTGCATERLGVVPGAGSHVSSNTDATHFASCRGGLDFNDCEFAGHGDDATNVHNYYYSLFEQSDDGCVVAGVVKADFHSQLLDYPEVGDTLAIIEIATLKEVGAVVVSGIVKDVENWRCRISCNGTMPAAINGYYLANVSALPRLRFIGCRVRSHRARSVLVKTRDVLIENCTFEAMTGTAVHIGAEGNWMEGMAAADVVVRNNRFLHCGRAGDGLQDQASAIAVNIRADDPTTVGLHKRLLFEGNEIVGGERGFAISNAEDVTIRGNRFSECRTPIYAQYAARVHAADNGGATVTCGECVAEAPATLPSVESEDVPLRTTAK